MNKTTSTLNSSILIPSYATTTSTSTSSTTTTVLADILLTTTQNSNIALLFFFLASFFFLVGFRFDAYRKHNNSIPLPPGPVPWPIFGNLPEMIRNKPAFRWILGFMKEMNTDIACFRLGNIHVIPVTCPKLGLEFLKKQDAVFASRPITMATDYASRGFLSIAVAPWGDQWKKMRRVVASEVINPARLRWLHDKRVEEADNLVRFIYNQCNKNSVNHDQNGAVIDMRSLVRQYSGNVIRKLMFNKRYFGEGSTDGGPGVEEEEHVDALFTVLSFLYAFCVSDYLPSLRNLDLDGHEKIIKKAIGVVNKYHDQVVEERIEQWRVAGNKNKVQEDLLDVLISLKDTNGKPILSTEEIKAQTADFIYASVDNPANAVEWAMAEMINQPDILEKAVDEIDRVVGKERLVQESDFSQLNYVKACAREAFRLHPIAPFNLPHVSNADTTVAGYFIPKGSHVLLSRFGLGRNPKVWDEPLKFKPERHLTAGSTKVELVEPELRFISFSTGRRGCMGAALGSAMTVMLLARVLQGFNWSAPFGELNVDLSESANDLSLAKPLHAHAKPRLPLHVYPAN